MRATLDGWLETRLDALERRLRTRDHLENRFTVGDLMMTTVLRELRDLSGQSNAGSAVFQTTVDTFNTVVAFEPRFDALVEEFATAGSID
ncbi:MAG: hypothetical protein AAFY22_11855, partial [Pseudomonadota bacterium]